MTLVAPFVGGSLGARAFCSVSPARLAGSSFTYAERSASKAPGARGMCVGSYQNENDMKKFGMFGIAAGMKALEGMLK
jgi:hypothetical protein